MPQFVKDYKFLSIATLLIGGLLTSIVVGEINSLISLAIIQSGTCVSGDAICLLKWHGYIACGVILLALLLELLVGSFRHTPITDSKRDKMASTNEPVLVSTKKTGNTELKPKVVFSEYRVDANEVLDDPFSNLSETLHKVAGILVENIGNEDIQCVAKLIKVERIKRTGKEIKYEAISIKEVNPRGYYLRWDDGQNGCVLTKFRPRRIDFASAYEDRGFFRQGNILFEKGYKRPLETGLYAIQVEIFRVDSSGQFKIKTVESVLGIHPYFSSSPSPIYGQGIHVKWLDKSNIKID